MSNEVPSAYLYTGGDGSKELILDCNGEHARVLLDLGYTETPLFASRATDTALAEELETLNCLRYLAQWLRDASGSRDESCGYVNGECFQMMTMCPDPEALASAINSIPRILAVLEGKRT